MRKERSKQIQMIIESLDEGDLKQDYHSRQLLYQYNIYNQEYSKFHSFNSYSIL